MTYIAFSLGLLAGIALLTLSVAALVLPQFQFWPPPKKDAWQDRLFWSLFRGMIACLVVVCVLDYHGLGQPPAWRNWLGWGLLSLGFGLAFRITAQLGWRDAHGEANQLNTEGWFAWSRNPIYVVSVIGMLGVSLAINSAYANGLLAIWALMYVLAPFAEEPWLIQKFGDNYRAYMVRVPRFVGRVRTDA